MQKRFDIAIDDLLLTIDKNNVSGAETLNEPPASEFDVDIADATNRRRK